MKDLVTSIYEELDRSELKKLNATLNRNRKLTLLDIKKGLAKKDAETIRTLAETTYASIGNYKDPDALWDAIDAGDIAGWEEFEDLVKQANGNKDFDPDTLINVIELLANGVTLDRAVATLAKKI